MLFIGQLARRFGRFVVFGNLYVAAIAVLLVAHTEQLFGLRHSRALLLFVGCATLCSYGLHWALSTPDTATARGHWTARRRKWLWALCGGGAVGACVGAGQLLQFWAWLLGIAAVAFVYTAPKIPYRPFVWLRGRAVAKTVYLAAAWAFVGVALPLIVAKVPWQAAMWYFLGNRFLLFLSVCMLFDWRDRANDHAAHIKNWATSSSALRLNAVFAGQQLLFGASLVCFCLHSAQPWAMFFILALPSFWLLLGFAQSKTTRSDAWFYGFLDGLVGISALLGLGWAWLQSI